MMATVIETCRPSRQPHPPSGRRAGDTRRRRGRRAARRAPRRTGGGRCRAPAGHRQRRRQLPLLDGGMASAEPTLETASTTSSHTPSSTRTGGARPGVDHGVRDQLTGHQLDVVDDHRRARARCGEVGDDGLPSRPDLGPARAATSSTSAAASSPVMPRPPSPQRRAAKRTVVRRGGSRPRAWYTGSVEVLDRLESPPAAPPRAWRCRSPCPSASASTTAAGWRPTVSYYSFFSVFPLMLVFVTVLGIVLEDNDELREDLIDGARRARSR